MAFFMYFIDVIRGKNITFVYIQYEGRRVDRTNEKWQ